LPLLDTNVLIDMTQGGRTPQSQRAKAYLAATIASGDTLFTSRVNEAELRVGPYRSPDPARESAKVDAVLATLIVLDLDAVSAVHFAKVKSHLMSIGRPAGDMDTLIAAIALAHGQRLVTRNPKHFADVPGLIVESY
jgi:predicted nucleic acid-binding protein